MKPEYCEKHKIRKIYSQFTCEVVCNRCVAELTNYNFNRKEEKQTMTNLKEEAEAFQPKKTLNVADLEALSLDTKIEDRSGTDKEGKEFAYKVAVIMGIEYRVPVSVLEEIKTLLEAKPGLKTIKVVKKGTGMNTKYSVIPME